MTDVIKLAIVDPNDESRESLKTALLNLESAWLEAECSRYEFFQDVVEQSRPDIGIINLDSNPDTAVSLIQSVTERVPECGLIVTSESSDGQLILRAIRAGAKEFVNAPVSAVDLVGALDRVSRHLGSPNQPRKKRTGKVFSVCAASGGVGATSVAVNLATVLAGQGEQSVALADLDLALGDADVFLDIIPEHTIVDLVQDVSRMDIALLKKSLAKHDSGVYLLPRPVHLDEINMVGPSEFNQIVSMMRASFNYTLVDLSKAYTALDIEALTQSDSILLVTQLDLPCLRNVVRIMNSLRDLKLDEKVHIIVNRVGLDSGQISLKKAKETLGRDIFWQIPNDYSVMVEVRNNGVPLVQQAPRAGITQSYRGLADRLSGVEEPQAEDKRNQKLGWLGFLNKLQT